MSTVREIWRKLSGSREYRKDYVSNLLKRGTAMQIQALMKQNGWTQTQLAENAGLTQGVISRASNPEYGNLTFNTVIEIAAGFDVAFIGRFLPFSEFTRYASNMPHELSFSMPSFNQDREPIDESALTAQARKVVFMKALTDKPKSAVNEFAPLPAEKKKPKSDDEFLALIQKGGLANAASVGSFI